LHTILDCNSKSLFIDGVYLLSIMSEMINNQYSDGHVYAIAKRCCRIWGTVVTSCMKTCHM